MKGGCFFDVCIILVDGSAIFGFRDGVGTFPCVSLFVKEGRVPIPCFKPEAM